MKKYLVLILFLPLAYACSNQSGGKDNQTPATNSTEGSPSAADARYDSARGAGKFTHIDLAPKLDVRSADAGKTIYELKCAACHKLSGEKLVGPGWQGVTHRRLPEWIMNFVTNTEEMIQKDPKVQAMLEICMVKMPNQNLSDDDARKVLEFMRKNDGVK